MKKILVAGGAGYIGAHMVDLLNKKGYVPVVVDNLSTGHKEAVLNAPFICGDLADTDFLDHVFKIHRFDAVMHFASFIQVGESVQKPSQYYRNNVSNTLNLLDAMIDHQVRFFVFSSTAAIFGHPEYTPIDEKHSKKPINPYGQSKLMVENILDDYEKAYGLKSCCLRYFNASGADPDARIGERHDPETHLIPLILQAASGRRKEVKVFGRDYETQDGTCIRDYIHVVDLCEAHILGLEKLMKDQKNTQYNLGNGLGFSVQHVIDTAIKVTGHNIKVIGAPRREGDAAVLVADSTLAKKELHWQPKYPELETIIEHAWRWEKKIM